jgi:hypothetical protein
MGWIQPTDHSWPLVYAGTERNKIECGRDRFFLFWNAVIENVLFLNIVTAKLLLRNNSLSQFHMEYLISHIIVLLIYIVILNIFI